MFLLQFKIFINILYFNFLNFRMFNDFKYSFVYLFYYLGNNYFFHVCNVIFVFQFFLLIFFKSDFCITFFIKIMSINTLVLLISKFF